MPTLFLVRHGKTLWTEEKRFAGWGNAPLSDTGRKEALAAGRVLKKSGYSFDLCLTSCLLRAKDTAQIIANEIGAPTNSIHYKWRLNERHYGALQNNLRAAMIQTYGAADVSQWRNNYHARPPELDDDDPRWHEQLERLPDIPESLQPRSESMAEAAARAKPLWSEEIAPALQSGKNVLVIAHTNSIRSLVGSIENLTETQLAGFRISTATPRHYELDANLAPLYVHDVTDSTKAKLHHWIIRKKLQWLGKL